MRKIIHTVNHKTDIEQDPEVASGQASLVVSRLNSVYAALGKRGDPRGRKSDGGPGGNEFKIAGAGRGGKKGPLDD